MTPEYPYIYLKNLKVLLQQQQELLIQNKRAMVANEEWGMIDQYRLLEKKLNAFMQDLSFNGAIPPATISPEEKADLYLQKLRQLKSEIWPED